MNKKAEMNYAGLIVITAIAVIIGTSLISTIGTDTGHMLNAVSLVNGSYSIGSVIGGKTWLVGQELLSTPIVYNESNGALVGATNYTIAEGVDPTTGNKGIVYTKLTNKITNGSVNISYDYGPEGYVEDAGPRAVIPLIIVFFALLIMVIALVPVLRSGVVDMFRG